MTYQEKLRALREDNDYTQLQIANVLGVAQTTYSQYELAKREILMDYLIKLCNFYKVSSDYVLGISQKKNHSD